MEVASLIHQVAGTLGLPEGALFATGREDLGNRLIDLQYLVKTADLGRREPSLPLKVAQILVFDLSRQGFRLDDGALVEMAVDLDDTPLWRVGFDCTSHTVYHLYGFADSDQGFNSLVKALGLKIKTAELALEVQSVFLALTNRSIQTAVRGEFDLFRAALDHYRGSGRVDDFLGYWNKCPVGIRRKIAPPSAVPSSSGFAIHFFADSDEGLQSVSLFLQPDGELAPKDRTVLYRWPSPKVKPN